MNQSDLPADFLSAPKTTAITSNNKTGIFKRIIIVVGPLKQVRIADDRKGFVRWFREIQSLR